MAERYLLESGSPDGYLLEDGSGILLMNISEYRRVIVADSPIGYWRLGESAGTKAYDEIGTNHGTYTNGVQLGRPGALGNDQNTATGYSLNVEYVSVLDIAGLDQGNGPLSWECWYKRSSATGSAGTLISKGSDAPILQLLDPPQRAFWYVRGSSNAVTAIDPVDTNWHHIVGTKSSGNSWLIYIDGVDVTIPNLSPTCISTATNLEFGRDASSVDTIFQGDIDEVALYNVVLTPAQVFAHYQAGVPLFISYRSQMPALIAQ